MVSVGHIVKETEFELRLHFLVVCLLVKHIIHRRFVCDVLFKFSGRNQQARGQNLLAEVAVVYNDTEDRLEKILHLPDGKLLRQEVKGDRGMGEFFLKYAQRISEYLHMVHYEIPYLVDINPVGTLARSVRNDSAGQLYKRILANRYNTAGPDTVELTYPFQFLGAGSSRI